MWGCRKRGVLKLFDDLNKICNNDHYKKNQLTVTKYLIVSKTVSVSMKC